MSKQRALAPLYRAFWSVYGRYAWDEQQPPVGLSSAPERVAALLAGRRRSGEECVLDAGCGTGNVALALARAGWRVVGVDFAPGMLACARAKLPADLAGAVSFAQADLDAPLAFEDGRFDGAVTISVLQAVADCSFVLAELHRVLKPGGALVVALPERDSPLFGASLGEAIRYRLRRLARRTPGRMLLVALKALGDYYCSGRRWTMPEAEEMLRAAGFEPLAVDRERQITVLAERLPRDEDGA